MKSESSYRVLAITLGGSTGFSLGTFGTLGEKKVALLWAREPWIANERKLRIETSSLCFISGFSSGLTPVVNLISHHPDHRIIFNLT